MVTFSIISTKEGIGYFSQKQEIAKGKKKLGMQQATFDQVQLPSTHCHHHQLTDHIVRCTEYISHYSRVSTMFSPPPYPSWQIYASINISGFDLTSPGWPPRLTLVCPGLSPFEVGVFWHNV
jgi:hypothetical protein